MNLFLFRIINGLAYKSVFLDKIMMFSSKYIPYIYGIIIFTYFIYGVIKNNRKLKYMTISIFILLLINFLISYIIGLVYYVPRPFVANKVNLLYPHNVSSSFPSSHALGVMTIALGISNKVKKIGYLLILVSILVGISRVYVGHHYPSDVIAGFIIAFSSNYIYLKLLHDKVFKFLKVNSFIV
ncbi:MAG: phosphatase PAP2 family protein [Clostridium tyrobutyricum]|jgi:undecaprenyl-diphosphatase|uniref:phosphatase PAP2 family protein n=1 Tax=Clostridium tyrobutyricum TaxID=1519 RepID=UPI002432E628|nr:phosphatase PAP2 family protein [Clostridium tyrobutyricum]MCH4201113.1 phosphatase PAP2 family protein [Clostridium tyrobutyricum]MCH4238497.1 phosphatase PAP2 family protein [Clostridium tyrobutyricum]MCH4260342.1 phosphatase PAP2 family protein [Clostridium tyrobutyricum]